MDSRKIALSLALNTREFEKQYAKVTSKITKGLKVTVKVTEGKGGNNRKPSPDGEYVTTVNKPKNPSGSGGAVADKALLKATEEVNSTLEGIRSNSNKQLSESSSASQVTQQAFKNLTNAVEANNTTNITGALQQSLSKSFAQPYTKLLGSQSRELNKRVSEAIQGALASLNKEIGVELSKAIKDENGGLDSRNSDAFIEGISSGLNQVFDTITERIQSTLKGETVINQKVSSKKGIAGTVENLGTNKATFQLLKNESKIIDQEIAKAEKAIAEIRASKSYKAQENQVSKINSSDISAKAKDERIKNINSRGAFAKVSNLESEIGDQKSRQAFYIEQAQVVSQNIKELTRELDTADFAELVRVTNQKKQELDTRKGVALKEKGKLKTTDEMVIRDKTPGLVSRLESVVSNLSAQKQDAINKAKKLDTQAKNTGNLKVDESDPWANGDNSNSDVIQDAANKLKAKANKAKAIAIELDKKLKKAQDALLSAREVQKEYASVQDATSADYIRAVRLEERTLAEAVAALEAKNKMGKRIPLVYKQILQLSTKLKSINPDKLPKLEVGLNDAYNAISKNLEITQSTLQGLGKTVDESSLQSIFNVTKAMALGYQSGFDANKEQEIKDGIANPKFVTTLRAKSKKEAARLAKAMQKYSNLSGVEYQRQLDSELSALRALESARLSRKALRQQRIAINVQKASLGTIDKASNLDNSGAFVQQSDKLFKSILELNELASTARVNSFGNTEQFIKDFGNELIKLGKARKDLARAINQEIDNLVEEQINNFEKREEGNSTSAIEEFYKPVTSEVVKPSNKEKAQTLAINTGQAMAKGAASVIRGGQALYGAAKAVEDVVLDLTGLQGVAGMGKAVAPYAATGVAAFTVPGVMPALELVGGGIHALLPAVEGLTSALGGAVGSLVELGAGTAVNTLASSLPFGGSAVAGAGAEVAGLLGASTTAAVSGAAGVVVEVGAAVAPLVIGTKVANKALKATADKLEEFSGGTQVTKKTQRKLAQKFDAVADAADKSRRYLSEVKDKYLQVTTEPYYGGGSDPKSKKLAAKEFKALHRTTRAERLEEQGGKLQALLPSLDAALASENKEIRESAISLKSIVSRKLKSINQALGAAKSSVNFAIPSFKDAKSNLGKQSLDLKANPKTEVLGNDFVDGYEGGIGSGMKRVYEVSFELAEEALDGIAKGQDSRSPSKKAKKKGKDLVDGYRLGIEAHLKDAERSAEKLGKTGADGINKGVKNISFPGIKPNNKIKALVPIIIESLEYDFDRGDSGVKSIAPNNEVKALVPVIVETLEGTIDRGIRDLVGKTTICVETLVNKSSSNIKELTNKASLGVKTVVEKSTKVQSSTLAQKEPRGLFTRAQQTTLISKDTKIQKETSLPNEVAALARVNRGIESLLTMQGVADILTDGQRTRRLMLGEKLGSIPQEEVTSNSSKTGLGAFKELNYWLLKLSTNAKFAAKQALAKSQPSRGEDYQDNLVNNFQENLDNYTVRIDSAVDAKPLNFVEKLQERFSGLNSIIEKTLGADLPNKLKVTKGLFLGLLPLAGLFMFRNQISRVVKELTRFNIELEATQQKLKSTGIQVASGSMFRTFAKDANAAGQSVQAYAGTLANLRAATKGKIGDPNGLTKDITQGFRKRGVVGESGERALTGISQIASKGVVSMEELRQQISEALPGAMSIAAESMGKTEKEFNRLVSTGQIMSADFLPKFAKALNAGAEVTDNLTSATIKLGNSWGAFKEGIVNVGAFKAALVPVNLVMSGLAAIAPALGLALGSVLAASMAVGIKALYDITMASKAARAGLLAVSKASVITGAAVVGVAAIFQVWGAVTNQSSKNIRKLADEMENLGKKQPPKKWESLGDIANSAYRSGFGVDKLVSLNPFNKGGKEDYELGLNYQGGNALQKMSAFSSARAAKAALKGLDDISKGFQGQNLKTNTKDLDAFAAKYKSTIDEIADLRYKANNAGAFGIEALDANKMQMEAEELQKKVDAEFELQFRVEDTRTAVATLEAAINDAQKEIDLGNEGAIKLKTKLEADLKQTKEELLKLNSYANANSPTLNLLTKADAKQQSLQSKLTNFNTAQEAKLYKEMLADGTNARVSEIKTRRLAVESRKEELKLTKEAIKIQDKAVSSLDKSQTGLLQKALGTTVTSADQESIVKAKDAFAKIEADGGKVDPLVSDALQKLEESIGNRAKINELEKEQLKDQYELKNAIKELKLEIKGLALEAANKSIEFKRFGLEASRFKFDRVNPLRVQSQDTSRQLAQSVKSQTLAYQQAIEGLQDFNYGIASSTRDLALKMVNVAREMQVAAINGVNSYLGAAGIQDVFGLGKIRDIITQAIGVTQSDRRPEIAREKADLERNFGKETRDQKRSQEAMNVDVQGQIYDNNRRKEEVLLAKERTVQDTALDIEALKLRRIELEKSKEETNRNIGSANLAAKEYGINERAGLVTANVPQIDEADLAGTAAAFAAYSDQLARKYDETNTTLANIAKKGNQRFAELTSEGKKLFQEQISSKDSESSQEAEKVAQQNAILIQTLEGNKVGMLKDMASQARTTRTEIEAVKESVKDLLAQGGMGADYYTQARGVASKKRIEIDSKIDEFRSEKKALEQMQSQTQFGGQAGVSQLRGFAEADGVSPEVKATIDGIIQAVESSGEYANLEKLLTEKITELGKNADKLEANKPELEQAAVNQFAQKYIRRNEDTAFAFQQSDIDTNSKLDDDSRTLAQARLDHAKEEIRIERELQDLKLAGEAPEEVEKYGKALSRLNDIKLAKVQHELKWTTKMVKMMQAPLENAFYGIGEAIGKSLGNAIDPTALQEKSNEINAQFGQDILDIQEKYADDPAKVQESIDRLQVLNNMKLDGLKNEFSLLGGILGSLKSAVLDFAQTLAKALIQKGVQKILGSAFGVGGFANGGEVGTYAKGGSVGCYASGGSIGSDAISKAMKKEKSLSGGKQPVLAALHVGEQVLSTLNNDAQVFRKLQVSGDWDRLKSGAEVSNFANGGTVGSSNPYSMSSGSSSGKSNSYNRSLSVNTTFNVKATDANSFRRSQGQIESRTNARLRESNARLS